jgi:hypothetical protein
MRPASIADFSKGYNVQAPDETMKKGELIIAKNCIWDDNGLIQRKGHRPYETGDYAASDVIRGVSPRVYLNGDWVDFIAVDDNSEGEVRFWRRTDTSKTLTGTTYVFTTGLEVYFSELNGKIIASNGRDAEIVFYYDGSHKVAYFDALDVRTWDDTVWNAGQYDAGASTPYVDDTTDAQDSGADDFQIGNTTSGDGFWIACAHPFTKVELKSAQQAGGSPVAVYEYYAADLTWKTLTLTTTPSWTATEADRTMEWAYNSDMARFAGSDVGLANFFCVRVRFTTAASGAFSCDEIEVYHSHYLDEATEGTRIVMTAAHGSRLFMATSGYIAFFTPPNDIAGVRGLSESEYFLEGGPSIRAMASTRNALIVFKDSATYAFYGSTVEDFLRKKISDVGLAENKAYCTTPHGVFFLAADGIHLQNGQVDIRVSDHIQPDIDGWTTTGAVATYYDGRVFFSFPAQQIVLWFDPATLEVDDETGEGRVAFYQFTGYDVDYFIVEDKQGDTGFLLAAVNDTTPYVARLENGTTDQDRSASTVNISYDIQIPYLHGGRVGTKKTWGALSSLLKKDASAATTYALTLYRDKGAASAAATISVAAGSGDHVQRSRIPYTMDGYNVSIRIQNSAATDAGVTGFEIERENKEL